jgi:hypothetical protein
MADDEQEPEGSRTDEPQPWAKASSGDKETLAGDDDDTDDDEDED